MITNSKWTLTQRNDTKCSMWIDWSIGWNAFIQYRFKWKKKQFIKKATPCYLDNFYLWVASAELPKWSVEEWAIWNATFLLQTALGTIWHGIKKQFNNHELIRKFISKDYLMEHDEFTTILVQ